MVFRGVFIAAVATFSALALTSCANPDPGVNAEANAVQRAGNPLATHPTRGQELAALAENRVVVNFPQGAAGLAAAEDRKLDLASRLFRDASPTLMFVTGHSDTAGEEYTNLLLSARRAEVVKRALVARGIPPNRLLLQALGTSDPANLSQPAAADNRRVVITWRLL